MYTFDYFYKEDTETEYRIMTFENTTEDKIKKIKSFIEMFEKTLETLNGKKVNRTFDDCDEWHKAAVCAQLDSWNKELKSLQNMEIK